MEWQPIETAPIHTNVLVYCHGFQYIAANTDKGGYWVAQSEGGFRLFSPTHWMPLPSPPNTGEKHGG